MPSLLEQILCRISSHAQCFSKFKKFLFGFSPNSCQLQGLLILIHLLISLKISFSSSLKSLCCEFASFPFKFHSKDFILFSNNDIFLLISFALFVEYPSVNF